ncbi:MAG TPA: asparagine synthase-related protein [Thermoanaerobaculia bacterium]|nr:asparagine synthase-related protein [Thermoanaerobaculia bacterium]
MENSYVARVIDLTDPATQRVQNMSIEEARARVASGPAEAVLAIDGSFALVARVGRRVRLARSLDRPMRYFLAKEAEGPALVVSDRIDAIRAFLETEGLAAQFHPSYTRMVPAHYVVDLELIGCPDPSPTYERYFTPSRPAFPADPDAIGAAYVGALADEIGRWLDGLPERAPIGVAFSGGIDSGAVFLVAYHLMRRRGLDLGRLKAFTLSAGDRESGPDLAQARDFLETLGLGLFLEPIEVSPEALDPFEAVRVVEDYKPLDVESATMVLALCRGIRERYPESRHLLDGDGGDENLKDYPIEENPELTIRSVVNNPMLYQEGWGVGRLKHSLTYSGGQSRSYCRTYAPLRHWGFDGFSPFTRPSVIELAEAIPFSAMAGGDSARLYAIKGDVVSRGVAAVTGLAMPVFPKRRFQHGAVGADAASRPSFPGEAAYRSHFLSLYV